MKIPPDTASSKLRPRRRRTRIRASPRYPYGTYSRSNKQHLRRTLRRRQEKQQIDFDLEECFDDRQESDRHFDADNNIGSRVDRNANSFSILKSHTFMSDLNPPIAPAEFSFRMPVKLDHDQNKTKNHLEDSIGDLQDFFSSGVAVSDTFVPNIQTLPTPPSTTPSQLPHAHPTVKLPARVCSTLSDRVRDGKEPGSSSYTNASSVLYHRKSWDFSVDPWNAEPLHAQKDFAIICGRDVPDPDFESYKDKSDDKQTALSGLINREGRFVAAALPLMGDDLQNEVSQLDQCRSGNILASLDLEDNHTSCSSYLLDKSIDGIDILPSVQPEQLFTQSPTNPSWSGIIPDPSARCLNTEIDLVYPQLPNPACSSATYHANKVPQSMSKDDGSGCLDDDDPIAKLWLAFERSVQQAPDKVMKPRLQSLNHIFDQHSRKSSSEVAQNTFIKQCPKTDIKMCPEINRLTFVPPWLYQHQYPYWPPTSFVKYRPICSENISGADAYDGHAKVEQAVDWMVAELGMGPQHTNNYNRSQMSATSLQTGFALFVEEEDTKQNVFAMAALPFSNPEISATSACDDDDEGYSSLYESPSELSEIDANEAAMEWNDWEEFDWDADIESEDERLGLFATEWGC